MEKIILLFISVLMKPYGFIYRCCKSLPFKRIMYAFYAEAISYSLAKAKSLRVYGFPIYITGGSYISLGSNVTLGFCSRLEAIDLFQTGQTFSPSIQIGNNTYIGPLTHIGCIDKVTIGENVSIGSRVYITDHFHGETSAEHTVIPPMDRPLVSRGSVYIGHNVSLGENVVVMPGVRIGNNATIGANSVVTHDIPEKSVAVGSPARVIKQLSI